MPKTKKKKPVTGIKSADKQAPTILALKRPDPPATIAEKSVKDEVVSLPTTEEPVSDDAASSLPLPQKPSIEVTNSTESEQQTDEEKPKKIKLPKSNPITTVTNSLGITFTIGDSIRVTTPWGSKEAVEIASIYETPSGEKWLQFKPCQDIKPGWIWEGGVVRAELATLITL